MASSASATHPITTIHHLSLPIERGQHLRVKRGGHVRKAVLKMGGHAYFTLVDVRGPCMRNLPTAMLGGGATRATLEVDVEVDVEDAGTGGVKEVVGLVFEPDYLFDGCILKRDFGGSEGRRPLPQRSVEVFADVPEGVEQFRVTLANAHHVLVTMYVHRLGMKACALVCNGSRVIADEGVPMVPGSGLFELFTPNLLSLSRIDRVEVVVVGGEGPVTVTTTTLDVAVKYAGVLGARYAP